MGNLNSVRRAYDDYYPKHELLRPRNIATATMVSKIAYDLFSQRTQPNCDCYAKFWFLTGTGVTLGLQLWVSWVSGLTMMTVLPRHQFGQVQAALFPKYFFLASVSTFLAFTSFLQMNPLATWKNESLVLVKKDLFIQF
jgi:hypothetical protein